MAVVFERDLEIETKRMLLLYKKAYSIYHYFVLGTNKHYKYCMQKWLSGTFPVLYTLSVLFFRYAIHPLVAGYVYGGSVTFEVQ